MAKSLTKKELKEPDAFFVLSAKVGHFIEKNIKPILLVLLLVVIGLAIWLGLTAYQSSQENAAAEDIYRVEGPVFATLATAKPEAPADISEYLKTLKKNGHTKAALASAMGVVGKLQTIEGTETQQRDVLSSISYVPPKSNVLFALSRMTYGNVAIANNDLDDAKKHFKSILDEKDQKPFHPSALIQLGGISEKTGDLAAARDFYQRVVQEFPDTEAKNVAEKLIIHLDLLSPSQGS